MQLTILDRLTALKWPQNAKELAQLSVSELQIWIAYQDPRELIYMAQQPEYKRFIQRHYLWPLKIKRLALKIKQVLGYA